MTMVRMFGDIAVLSDEQDPEDGEEDEELAQEAALLIHEAIPRGGVHEVAGCVAHHGSPTCNRTKEGKV